MGWILSFPYRVKVTELNDFGLLINMKVYLLYGLATGDFCNEPFVRSVFRNQQDARIFAEKCVANNTLNSWFIVEMEVE